MKVRKKGVIILPKAVRVEVGMEEGSIVELEAKNGSLVIQLVDQADQGVPEEVEWAGAGQRTVRICLKTL